MAKSRISYVCSHCGESHSKWQGQCLSCEEWNTIQEFKPVSSLSGATSPFSSRTGYSGDSHTSLQSLSDVDIKESPRIPSGISELDRVLGGGLVPGSAVLIGGQPGAGKSTLLLQTICYLAAETKVLYVSGEESLQQIAMRANRLGLPKDNINMLVDTDVENICHHARQLQPSILVIDSIQVMSLNFLPSAPGTVTQVRESAAAFVRYAKQTSVVLLMIGHVTKDGHIAGPKVLEHMIDTAMLLESCVDSRYRTLRSYKNRFGAINEFGVFAMMENGLKEVKNPSAIFLSRQDVEVSGSAILVTWEGTRSLLVEIQALVDNVQGNPKRLGVGIDQNRLTMILAVLHRHGGLMLSDQDVFVNVVGGIKALETGADLAVLLAVASSFRNKPLGKKLIIFGEVGLSGEIRPVPSGQERLQEAIKHGFTQAIIPKLNMPKVIDKSVSVYGVETLEEALALI
jgi:DNA repair protein RadA/Sms